MIRAFFHALIVAVVLGTCHSPVRADDLTKGSFTGTIEALNAKFRELSVKSELSSMTFLVSKDARIVIRENTNAQLEDLQVGDRVIVEYEEKEGIKTAIVVTLKENDPPVPPSEAAPFRGQ